MSHLCDNEYCQHSAALHANGRCEGEVTDLYGTWTCLCVRFQRDPDDE